MPVLKGWTDLISEEPVIRLIRAALEEDIGPGDVTSRFTVPPATEASGIFIARERLVIAGIELLPLLYKLHGGGANVTLESTSGEIHDEGGILARAHGPAQALLECERTALNFLQHLSGIATVAREFADRVAHTQCKVLDTRKTTPGYRLLEKASAHSGGVMNHRIGLFDAILIKNNHIEAAGGVTQAIERARKSGLPIEIEVRTEAELDEALSAGADHLLLDNLTPAQAGNWIERIGGRARVELSGGVTVDTVALYAETGADWVSSGAITHSARAVDISFRLQLESAECRSTL